MAEFGLAEGTNQTILEVAISCTGLYVTSMTSRVCRAYWERQIKKTLSRSSRNYSGNRGELRYTLTIYGLVTSILLTGHS